MRETIIIDENKRITVCSGDICESDENFDLLICSAFKGSYMADGKAARTLIGNLKSKKNISVEELAKEPQMDFKADKNCWVSKAISGSNISRIACVEILEPDENENENQNKEANIIKVLKETFASVYYLLKQMSGERLPLKRIVLPILGNGNQDIELDFIIPPLISQCTRALKDIPELEEIVFCDLKEENINKLYIGLTRVIINKPRTDKDIFISYSSKQRALADKIREYLEDNGITCWMAPDSIPSGTSYQSEIPSAINNSPIVLLILSEDSEKSRWVQKEVGSAIGAGHFLIPYMDEKYEHSQQFNFVLDGEQIFEAYNYGDEDTKQRRLLDTVKQKLGKPLGETSAQKTDKKTDIIRDIVTERPAKSQINADDEVQRNLKKLEIIKLLMEL